MSTASPYADRLARVPVEEHVVTVLGGQTHYWVYGAADAPVTMVLVHGFRGDHHGLEPVIATLPGVRFIAPDLPGFGASGLLPGRHLDIVAYRDWLLAFVTDLDIADSAVILGHSFGSIVVASALAAGLPSPKAVLVNPIAAPALKGPRGIMTRLAVFYYWLGSVLPERLGQALLRSQLVVRVMSNTMAKTRDPELLAFVHDQHRRYFSAFATRSSLLESFQASVSHDVSEYAPRIATPTLLIAAEKDDITRVSEQHKLVALFADAQLHVIPDVGHLIHYETPAEAAAQITKFIAE